MGGKSCAGTVSGSEVPQANALLQRALAGGLRAELAREGSLAGRIRAARLVPYQAIIGPKEAAAGEVSLRLRDGGRLDPLPVREVLDRIGAVVNERAPLS